MYELEYLYEQLKQQIIENEYINVLNSVTENSYDILEPEQNITKTMNLIEESSKNGKLNLIQKFKTNIATAEKVLSNNKDAALKCRPIGLVYKDFKTFMSDSDIKNMHQKAVAYLNKFNPDKASEEELKQFILDSNNNVQYKEINKIFGMEGLMFIADIFITKKDNKELTKNDISDAVKYLQNYKDSFKNIVNKKTRDEEEFYKYLSKNNGMQNDKTDNNITKLRKNAENHKRTLMNIADNIYYTILIEKMKQEFNQAKHIVVKAANYNPRNIKESYAIQDYIDSMYDFHESDELLEAVQLEGFFSKNKDDENMKKIAAMPINSLASHLPDFIKSSYDLSDYRKLTSSELDTINAVTKSLHAGDSRIIYEKDILGTHVVIIEKIGEAARYMKDPKMIYIYYANKYDSDKASIPKSHTISFSTFVKYISLNS